MGDGVGALDAAVAVLAASLRALRRGGGLCLVGEAPGVGPGAGLEAVFVLAGAHAPGVVVGQHRQSNKCWNDYSQIGFVPICGQYMPIILLLLLHLSNLRNYQIR